MTKSRAEEVNGWENTESEECQAEELENEGVWTEPRSEGVTRAAEAAGVGKGFVRAF